MIVTIKHTLYEEHRPSIHFINTPTIYAIAINSRKKGWKIIKTKYNRQEQINGFWAKFAQVFNEHVDTLYGI